MLSIIFFDFSSSVNSIPIPEVIADAPPLNPKKSLPIPDIQKLDISAPVPNVFISIPFIKKPYFLKSSTAFAASVNSSITFFKQSTVFSFFNKSSGFSLLYKISNVFLIVSL